MSKFIRAVFFVLPVVVLGCSDEPQNSAREDSMSEAPQIAKATTEPETVAEPEVEEEIELYDYLKIAAEEASKYEETRLAAKQGDAVAQYELGRMYENGWGVEQEWPEAAEWYKKSADQGYAPAQYEIGLAHLGDQGKYRTDKPKENAAKWFQMAAAQGYADAQNALGQIHYEKKGFDFVDAAKLFRMAAEQGHAQAQNNLATAYLHGHGVAPDEAEALKWLRLAAGQGFQEAQKRIYDIYDSNARSGGEALAKIKQAAEAGDTVAQNYLGLVHTREGLDFIAWARTNQGIVIKHEDTVAGFVEAAKWYRKAAEQGDAYAQYELAQRYEKGRGVTQDFSKAVKWLRKAAEQGHLSAQSSLGEYYVKGEGVTKNYNLALKWLRKAAERGKWRHGEPGSNEAAFLLARIYDEDHYKDFPNKNHAYAMKWYYMAAWRNMAIYYGVHHASAKSLEKEISPSLELIEKRAKEQGNVAAQRHMGWRERERENFAGAMKWYLMAAEQGDMDSQYNLGRLHEREGSGSV